MTDDKEDLDDKQRKTGKIVLFIVAPVLFITAGLLVISDLSAEEKPSYSQILSQIDLNCYNINWFGIHGFQVTYKKTIGEIGMKLNENDMDFTSSEFFENQEVIDYLVVYCPHIDSRLQVPETFDPSVGINVVDKCLEKKVGTVDFKGICAEYIK